MIGIPAPGSAIRPTPDDELVDAIRDLLAQGPFHGRGLPQDRKIWARLRFAGIRTSKRRVLRLTCGHGLQAPCRVGRSRGPKAHDGTIRTERVDLMWGSDRTSTMTASARRRSSSPSTTARTSASASRRLAWRATRFEALEPIREGVRACSVGFAESIAYGLELRHDRGSLFVTDDSERELAFLDVTASPAFVGESEGNDCAKPNA